MSERIEQVSKWFYHGVWGVLTKWFHVPQEPPQLPVLGHDSIRSFRPAHGFLKYLTFQFWLTVFFAEIGILAAWIGIGIASPYAGIVLTPIALFLMIVPEALAFLAIHLRYDTTWYVMSERSLRIRRGIWVIHETTITFENVQNVAVEQGPLQRFFRIADVTVQTAGGGGSVHGSENHAAGAAHRGLIEGVDNAIEIRDLIMSRLQKSRASGLGDDAERETHGPIRPLWTAEHLAILRDIRDAAGRLAIR